MALLAASSPVFAFQKPHTSQRKQSHPVPGAAKPAVVLDVIDQHLQSAETYQLAADFDHAASEYRRGICEALRRFADGSVGAMEGHSPIDLLQNAIVVDPQCAEARIDLGYAYFRAGNLAQAKEQADQGLSAGASVGRSHALLGSILFMQADYDAAAAEFNIAVKDTGDFSVAYGLGLSYLRAKKPSSAQVVFDDMLDASHGNPDLETLVGRAYQQTGYNEQAASHFRRALAINPKQPRAHAYLGVIELANGSPDAETRAREQFKLELERDPKDYTANFNLGVIEFKHADYADAEREFEAAKSSAEAPFESLLYLARTYAAEKKSEASRQSALQALKSLDSSSLDPASLASARRAVAEVLDKAGDAPEADRQRALAQDLEKKSNGSVAADAARSLLDQSTPGPAKSRDDKEKKALEAALGNAYHNLAVILSQRQQYAEAERLFASAAQWQPDIPTLDQNWGIAAFRAAKYKEAIPPLQRQVQRVPNDDLARQSLGVSYFMVDDYAHAAEVFARYSSVLPENPGVLYAAGVSFSRSGKSAEAARVFRKLLEQNQRVPEIHVMLGQAYASGGDFDQARAEYAAALDIDPSAHDAHYFTAMSFIRQGNMEQAERELRAELEVNQFSVDAKYQLGYVLLAEKRATEAIDLLKAVTTAHPEHGDAQYELGRALLEQGDVPGAVACLEAAARLMPDRDYPYYQLSLAYSRQGRSADAEGALEKYRTAKNRKLEGASNAAH